MNTARPRRVGTAQHQQQQQHHHQQQQTGVVSQQFPLPCQQPQWQPTKDRLPHVPAQQCTTNGQGHRHKQPQQNQRNRGGGRNGMGTIGERNTVQRKHDAHGTDG